MIRVFTIQYHPGAIKDLKKISIQWQVKIKRAIKDLCSNPYRGKKLQGELDNLYAIRIWPYRVIYKIHKQEIKIIILHIGHRQGVYS
ncbi:MAG: hypothetical protein A2V81_02805 [Candidatus Abawacabacteria bacterium RBG_16_42_10]|uniref:Addiction module toxin RelE n=1 Tax=Candidatus Abawacabacteria bacterium RBG_16_42_10 TaxID=1817814 RepID=A0A1F4XKB7_9BACT|nr:MAG: hypothetical protein A2V81_02805 [Candidatus Abawacabacteria bacterium RBG_16_42_10]